MFARIGSALAPVFRGLPVVIRDLSGLAAVGLIAYGAWLIAPAAGFITAGVLLLAGVILVSIKSAKAEC